MEADSTSGFNTPDYRTSPWISGLNWNVTLPVGTWYWRVRARDADAAHNSYVTGWSGTDEFEILASAIPTIPALTGYTDDGGSNIYITWSASAAGGDPVVYYVSVTSSASDNFMYGPTSGTDMGFAIDGCALWSWTVRAQNARTGEYSSWSAGDSYQNPDCM